MYPIPRDPRLRAVAVRGIPLRYRGGADPALDRPFHVRAASGLCWTAGRWVIVQDDAAFLAIVDPADLAVEDHPLPASGGMRLWGDDRGNKHLKPDLESCVALEAGTVLALGSGSTVRRERALLATGLGGPAPVTRWIDCPALYAVLRAETSFSGSEMNIEGAALVPGALRLFNRGNGAPAGGLRPVNSTCDLPLDRLRAYLEGEGPAPHPERVVQYELGSVEGIPLSFTDATAAGGGVLFSAAAEASPDAYHDGPVAGSALGYLRGESGGWALLETPDGDPFPGKVEGIAPAPDRPDRVWVVVDHDHPATPAELWEAVLEGPWPDAG